MKYEDLAIEMQRMWNVTTTAVPVTGTIERSFRNCVSNVPGHHQVREPQKTASLGTAHIFRKVLT